MRKERGRSSYESVRPPFLELYSTRLIENKRKPLTKKSFVFDDLDVNIYYLYKNTLILRSGELSRAHPERVRARNRNIIIMMYLQYYFKEKLKLIFESPPRLNLTCKLKDCIFYYKKALCNNNNINDIHWKQ